MLIAAGTTSGLEIDLIQDLAVILGFACLSGLIFQKLKLALIPAYLISGVIIGPHALNFIPWPEGLEIISHLAILLLLFSIGLELHLGSLKGNIFQLVSTGISSCFISSVIGFCVLYFFNFSWPQATVIAMGLSLSSTSVVLKILFEKRQIKDIKGRFSLAILVIQDLLVLVMLASLPLLASLNQVNSDGILSDFSKQSIALVPLLFKFSSLIILMVSLKYFLPRIFEYTQRVHSLELLVILSLATILGVSLFVKFLGFSLEMGAFISGLFLANSILRYQVGGQVIPLRDLFIAIFFTTLGMKLNSSVLVENITSILGFSIILILLKTFAIGGICWLLGLSLRKALPIGLILSQAGEFSLILFESAQKLNLIDPQTMTMLIAIVIISLIVTPFLFQLAGHLEARLPHWPGLLANPLQGKKFESLSSLTEKPQRKRFIIAGYGPTGQSVTKKLNELGICSIVIEMNAITASKAKKAGHDVLHGDITNPAILEAAGIDQAQGLCITIPDDDATLRACSFAKKLNPDLFVAVRLQSIRNREKAQDQGANEVIVEEMAVWEQFFNILEKEIHS